MRRYAKTTKMESTGYKRVLVTGSDGFIGKRLAKRLKDTGVEVQELDKSKGQDITSMKTLEGIGNTGVVFHLAGVTFVPYSWEHPRETYETNLKGTLNVLEYCRTHSAKLVFPSTYVYGRPKYLPIDEKHPVAPSTPYSWSKYLCEGMCQAYNENFGLKCTILRKFNVFGPGQSRQFLISEILHKLNEGGIITLKDAAPKRDYVYVDDVIDAYLLAARYEKKNFNVFNIGYGKSYSVREIVQLISRAYGKDIDVTYQNQRRANEVMNTVADITKARKELKWKPQTKFEDGIKAVVEGFFRGS
jgi:nucleoside-diphosphate-sugar epimerase